MSTTCRFGSYVLCDVSVRKKKTKLSLARKQDLIVRMLETDKSTLPNNSAISFPSVVESAEKELYNAAMKANNGVIRKRGMDRDDSLLRIAINTKKQQLLSREIKMEIRHTECIMKSLEIQQKIIETYAGLCGQEIPNDVLLMFKENICKLATRSVRVADAFQQN